MTTKRIRRFDPTQVAKVTGVLYAIMGAIFSPIFIAISMFAPTGTGYNFGIWFAILIPVFYGIMGAIVSFIAAALYNVVAKWVGGIEVEVE